MTVFQAVVWDNGEILIHIFFFFKIKVKRASHFIKQGFISPLVFLGECCSFETSLCCLRLLVLLVTC